MGSAEASWRRWRVVSLLTMRKATKQNMKKMIFMRIFVIFPAFVGATRKNETGARKKLLAVGATVCNFAIAEVESPARKVSDIKRKIKQNRVGTHFKEMYSKFDNLDITVDSSIKKITRKACMYLSEAIENGIMLSENPTANIVIYDDRIDFGMCLNPTMDMMNDAYFPNFYEENGNIVYRFAGNASCEVEDHTINYVGHTDPITADDNKVFNMIYSKYA